MDRTYMDVEDLDVYQRLCQLHIDVCEVSHFGEDVGTETAHA